MPDNEFKYMQCVHRTFPSIHASWHTGKYYLVLWLSLSSNCIVFYFSFCIHLNSQSIGHFLLSAHIQWILGHMNFWESTPISKILQKRKSNECPKDKKNAKWKEKADRFKQKLTWQGCSSNFIISLVREQLMRELTVIKRHWNGETSCSNYSLHKVGTDITD